MFLSLHAHGHMAQVVFRQLHLTALLIYLILLQGDTLALESISENNRLKYFKNNILHVKEQDNLSTKKCTSKLCHGPIRLPHGEQVLPLPGDVTIVLPISMKDLEDKQTLNTRRIVGGKPVPITEFPFIVSVQEQKQHACGGSYIKPKWVLTAAHCLVREMVDSPLKNRAEFTIVMGSALIEGNSSAIKQLQVRQVELLYPHEEYTKAIALNDIGLIKIERPFVLNSGVAFAPLPKNADDGEYREEYCTVLGWGITSDKRSSESSPILMSTQIPLITLTMCQRTYDMDRIVPLKVMCAGFEKGGKDACQGDSGGPLVCHHMEIGLVSWGRECGRPNQYGVYTRIDYYLEWIDQTIKDNAADSYDISDTILYSSSSSLLHCPPLNILIFWNFIIKTFGIAKNIFIV